MLTRAGARLRAWVAATPPFTGVYGVARTLLALGTAGTLAFSHSTSIWRPALGADTVPDCAGMARATFFCLPPSDRLELARWVAVVLLLVVASGWRPRLTGVLHWWVSFSLHATGMLVDGGEQVTAILALLLVPVTLADPRRWHWDPPPTARDGRGAGGLRELAALFALSCLLMARVQVAGIYFHAAVSKTAVAEWRNGTAVYYWFTDPSFGLPEWLRPLGMPLLVHPVSVALLTWGAIVLEVLLFTGLVMAKGGRRHLLWAGIAFHAAIAFGHGLPSFAFAMWGGLVLYLRPVEQPWTLPRFAALGERLRRATAPAPPPLAAPAAAVGDALSAAGPPAP